jgi:hypothetical protein
MFGKLLLIFLFTSEIIIVNITRWKPCVYCYKKKRQTALHFSRSGKFISTRAPAAVILCVKYNYYEKNY